MNIGAYTGSSNGSSEDRFEMNAGTLNLTAGTINIYGQNNSSGNEALDLASKVTVNSTTSNTINLAAGLGSNDENMYMTVGGNELGNLTIANTSNIVYTEDNVDLKGNLTISSGTFNADHGNDNLNLEGDLSISGTLDANNQTITFDGTASTSCPTISDPTLDIEVNKSSGGIVTFVGTNSFNEFTVTAGKAAMTSNTITADNTISIADGAELEIGTGTFNADGAINANATGEIDFTGDGKLILSSSVTSLGTLDEADGTVEYDGGTQNVISDTYNKLSIKSSGTKTATGNITVNGDLTTENTSGCVFDIDTRELTAKGGITVGFRGGLDLADGTLNLSGASGAQGFTSPGSYTSGSNVSINAEHVMTDSDDCFEYDYGSVSYSESVNIRLGNRSGGSYGDCFAGLRFQSVPVPQGATIASASIKVRAKYDPTVMHKWFSQLWS